MNSNDVEIFNIRASIIEVGKYACKIHIRDRDCEYWIPNYILKNIDPQYGTPVLLKLMSKPDGSIYQFVTLDNQDVPDSDIIAEVDGLLKDFI